MNSTWTKGLDWSQWLLGATLFIVLGLLWLMNETDYPYATHKIVYSALVGLLTLTLILRAFNYRGVYDPKPL